MKVHVVRSPEVSRSLVTTIYEIIKEFNKPVNFKILREDLADEDEDLMDESVDTLTGKDISETGENSRLVTLTWKELFRRCEEFRQTKKIKDDDVVVLLTDFNNELNWFSSWDLTGRRNFFIQTSRWDKLVDAEACYPVLYELAIIPLYLSVCKSPEELNRMAHRKPRGCPFDLCDVKTDVQIRLRTGDICRECHDLIAEKKMDFATAGQVFGILDLIRSRILFRSRFGITSGIPKMNFDTANQDLVFFNDNGKVKVHLSKSEMLCYLLFLNHEEGIRFKNMADHSDELAKLYKDYFHNANLPEYENTLRRMTDTVMYNTLSEYTSRIKNKLNYYLLDKEIAGMYAIEGPREEEHRILADRSLITINNRPFRHVPGGLV